MTEKEEAKRSVKLVLGEGRRGRARVRAPHDLLATTNLVEKLRAVEVRPWETITAPALAEVLGIDVLTFNDWRYRRLPLQPPMEPRPMFRGAAARYRKDRLIAWATSLGEHGDTCDLWPQGAEYLQAVFRLGPHASATATDTTIEWLEFHGLIERPQGSTQAGPYRPYGSCAA